MFLLRGKKKFLAVLAYLLTTCQVLAPLPVSALGTPDVSSTEMSSLVNESTAWIAPGVSEKRITYVSSSEGKRIECFEADVDVKNPDVALAVGTPDDGTASGMQTVRAQAGAAAANGKNVVAAVNGDFYNMATGEPEGCLLKDGVEIHPASGSAFFGITKDGTPVIGDSAAYQQTKGSLQQAMSSNALLVKNGKTVGSGTDKEPRTAVGIRADNTVFFLVIDGRQEPYSAGISLGDLAKLMLDMGAVQAANLDGGGSSTYISRIPGDDGLTLKNKPSDGAERTVANSWLIVSKAVPDHAFASAAVTPFDQTFTPGATVSFAAHGMDASGASAPLPQSGLSWSLSDPSFGTIDAGTGVFVSNGKQGQVQARVSYNGNVVGSTYVEIAVPDDIHFTQQSMSLKFDTEQDLGLVVRYQGRDVTVHPGDIQWTFDAALGVMGSDNIFHSSGNSASGPVSAQFKGTDLSASLNLQVGQLPVIMYDFENGLDNWSASTAGRGEKSGISLASYPGDPVRFGNHSLKMDFDFTNAQKSTTLGAYAGPSVSEDIPGSPTAIGMWVYATPEAQGYWLRMYIYDQSGTAKPIDLTTQTAGIDWTGWKYVEAEIPSNYQGPYKSFPYQMIRLMSLKSGTAGGGPMTAGSIYVDNIRAVYGANVDDLYSPIVDSISVDGKTYTNSAVNIKATIHDDASDKYMSGINWSRAKILVDGKDYTTDQGHFSYDMDGTLNLTGLSWPDGIHKVTADIQDNFGNETTKDAYFTVSTGTGTKVELQQGGDSAPLGGTYRLSLTTNRMADIRSVEAAIQINKNFPVSGVEFSGDAAGSTYDYDAASGILSLHIINSSANTDGELAAVDVSIPAGSASDSRLDYSVLSSSIGYAQDKGGAFVPSFSAMPASIPVAASYQIAVKSAIVGQDGVVLVTDSGGNPVAGASVAITVDGGQPQQLGETDAAGTLSSPVITQAAQKFTLTAEKDGGCAFPLKAQSYQPVKTAAPSNLLTGATQDPKTEKCVTWMTNPLQGGKTPVMQVAAKAAYDKDGDRAFRSFQGTQQVLTYDADSAAVMLNSALATGLTPGTAYVFRVGDGTNWSDVRPFTTLTDTAQFTFNVFGDTQVTEPSGLNDFAKMLQTIETAPTLPAFMIHVGDFTDDQTIFNEMDMTASFFNQYPLFDSIDMIHVLGNHEYMGDNGTKSALALGMPNTNGADVNKTGTYSVDYGNMHIAVIGWTDQADEMQKEMDWLRQDMKATKQTWKIIATHQPAYNKNPADAQSTLFHDMLTPVCDELGIDIVFNGHDHSYGRTFPLINDKPAAGGTVYIATGHTGDKTYDIQPNDPSVFDFVQSDKNETVYLTCTVDGNKLHLTATRPDGSIMDQADLTAHPADKTALQAAVGDAAALDLSAYVPAGQDAFRAALDAANALLGNAGATQTQVDNAADALTQAMGALKKQADKTALHTLVDQAAAIDPSLYASAGIPNYQAALQAAQHILTDNTLSTDDQAAVDQAWAALRAAIDALVPAGQNPVIQDGSGKSGWNSVLDAIGSARSGDRLVIDMNGATVLPQSVVSALSGKDVTLELDMGSYKWIISGLNVTEARSVDLTVRQGTAGIPDSAIRAAAGDKTSLQLSLSQTGPFGLVATLEIRLGKENEGKTAELYSYDGNGNLILQESGPVAADGSAELSFSRGGDYAIVLDSPADAGNGGAAENPSSEADTAQPVENPKTGDARGLPFILEAVGALLIFAAVMQRRRAEKH